MKKIFALLIAFLFAFNCFVQSDEGDIPSDPICSPKHCYKLIKELGEGFFGKVYAAENSSGQMFAIKMYKQKEGFFVDHPFTNAAREYEYGMRLNHANILKPVELFKIKNPKEEKEAIYLVLEFIDGTTLFDVPRKSLFPNQAIQTSLQLVDALRYALAQGFIHMDLHALNVMVTNSVEIRVIDLASFYSFDEIFSHAEEERKSNLETIPENLIDFSPSISLQKKKLKQFFIAHPQLLEKIQLVGERQKKNKKNYVSHVQDKCDSLQRHMLPILSFYFDQITDICTNLIMKSNLSRGEKIRMRIAIKAAAWNYLEDSEEDLLISIDFYFDQLLDILQS